MIKAAHALSTNVNNCRKGQFTLKLQRVLVFLTGAFLKAIVTLKL